MGMIWLDLTPLSTRWPTLIRRWFEKGKWVFKCNSCGSVAPLRWASSTAKDENGNCLEWCSECSKVSAPTVPDVYWDGKPEPTLANDPVTGKERVFRSKREKAQYLQQRGLTEAGDRVHGSYASALDGRDARPSSDRSSALRALQRVRQMGKDVRRQEYLRIVKEGAKNA